MRKLFLLLSVCAASMAGAQNKEDTIALLQRTAALYNLQFTAAEADSMLGDINEYTGVIKAMHKTAPPNSLLYPFAYNPAPIGFKIPAGQQKISWVLPANVTMPANKSDLAFYSVAQLASLIKSKKISSVALTHFFFRPH